MASSSSRSSRRTRGKSVVDDYPPELLLRNLNDHLSAKALTGQVRGDLVVFVHIYVVLVSQWCF